MKKIGVIINPNAKKFRTGKVSINTYMDYNSENVIISTPESIEQLKATAELYKQKKSEYICIGGGDGTIHVVLSELMNAFNPQPIPPILILKEGTMDNIARSVKLKGKGPALLKRLIKKIEEKKVIETKDRYTIKIKDKYCFLFGTGLVTNFLNKAYSGKEKGPIRNLQVALMGAKEGILNVKDGEIFRLTEQAIFIDGKKVLINPVSGILAGTVEHIGMGFSPLPEAVQSDGTFQVIISGMNPRGILRYLNRIRTGKRIKSPKYLNVFGKSILIKQKGIFEYTMDGDIYTAENELNVSAGPKVKLVKI